MTDGTSSAAADDVAERPDTAVGPGTTIDRARLTATSIASVVGVALVATLHHVDAVLERRELAINWQIDALPNLIDNPFTSTWYRHVQPPLYNLFVGVVLRWSPFPAIGTLQVLWALMLIGSCVLLADILVALRVPGIAAGIIAGLAFTNPNLLVTIPIASYEVPLTLLLLASLRTVIALLERPTTRRWILLSVLLTVMALTRSLFHPLWVVGVLVVVAVLRRPPRRVFVAVLLLPVLTIGGWMLKNQVLFGEATTSSWIGFNMTRGVTATMTPEQVDAAIEAGDVSELAREYPWGRLWQYEDWADGCVPGDRHPSLSELLEPDLGGANFNNECFLPVYRQASADARALILRYPGRYLTTRWEVLRWSFATSTLGYEGDVVGFAGGIVRAPTWMDRAGDVWLLPVDVVSDQSDWNLPLLGIPELPGRISLTLAVAFVVVVGRGGPAGVRLVRHVRRRRSDAASDDRSDGIDPVEVVWFLVAATAVMVVVGSALLEFGENGRFRALLDPLLVGLPAGMAVAHVRDRFVRRADRTG